MKLLGPVDGGDALLTRARAIERTLVRLFFSDGDARELAADREGFALRRGVDPADCRLLPDPRNETFRVERHGRKVGVAREVHRRFSVTLRLLGAGETPSTVATSNAFTRFLESDLFLPNKASFPHPYGMGLGYENISRFFLWLRKEYSLVRATVKAGLRGTAYLEACRHFAAMSRYSIHPFYTQMNDGARFAPDLTKPDEVVVVGTNGLCALASLNALQRCVSSPPPDFDQLLDAAGYGDWS